MAGGGAWTFHKNKPGWDYEFNSPVGTVGWWLHEEGRKVARVAKRLEAPHRRTGRLLNSIHGKRPVVGRSGLYVEVEATAPYALAHHRGAKPFTIRPKDDEVLVFPVKGRVVKAQKVRHPGFEGHPFLRDALVVVAATWRG